MANLSILEVLEQTTLAIKTYVDALGETKLDAVTLTRRK